MTGRIVAIVIGIIAAITIIGLILGWVTRTIGEAGGIGSVIVVGGLLWLWLSDD